MGKPENVYKGVWIVYLGGSLFLKYPEFMFIYIIQSSRIGSFAVWFLYIPQVFVRFDILFWPFF